MEEKQALTRQTGDGAVQEKIDDFIQARKYFMEHKTRTT